MLHLGRVRLKYHMRAFLQQVLSSAKHAQECLQARCALLLSRLENVKEPSGCCPVDTPLLLIQYCSDP